MKFVAIIGSRNPKGQTATAVDAFAGGVEKMGEEFEQIYLPPMKIERCRQCDENGWGICRTQGKCIIEDDFASIVSKIKDADGVVFATPVYFGDLSESIRAFLDRLRRICMHEVGRQTTANKKAIGICVAGGGGGGSFSCSVSLEKIVSTCGFDLFDVIPVRRQNLEMKIPILEATGRWMAK